jgi:hypothetical protein
VLVTVVPPVLVSPPDAVVPPVLVTVVPPVLVSPPVLVAPPLLATVVPPVLVSPPVADDDPSGPPPVPPLSPLQPARPTVDEAPVTTMTRKSLSIFMRPPFYFRVYS